LETEITNIFPNGVWILTEGKDFSNIPVV